MKIGIAGSFDSCDALITVIENDKLEIEIESIVENQFKDEIEKVIRTTLQALDLDKVNVICKDKGALNYTIRARLLSAIARMSDDNA
jgi:citrate lyase subunit gamma (acyl carrier protein)